MRNLVTRAFVLALALTCFVQQASADTIIKFGLSEIGPDVAFDGATFGTVDDGIGSTTGEQNTGLNFVGPLLGVLADVLSGASFTLSDVLADGPAITIANAVIQNSIGGTFSVWDANNNLLLSGTLGAGAIQGSLIDSTGSYFNTTFATLTGGSLLPYLESDTAGMSLALSGIVSASGEHLSVAQGVLAAFSANASGLIDANAAVPEPATSALLLSGALGLVARRRRKA